MGDHYGHFVARFYSRSDDRASTSHYSRPVRASVFDARPGVRGRSKNPYALFDADFTIHFSQVSSPGSWLAGTCTVMLVRHMNLGPATSAPAAAVSPTTSGPSQKRCVKRKTREVPVQESWAESLWGYIHSLATFCQQCCVVSCANKLHVCIIELRNPPFQLREERAGKLPPASEKHSLWGDALRQHNYPWVRAR